MKRAFTKDQEAQIGRLYEQGQSTYELAKTFNVSQMTVHRALVRNKTERRPDCYAKGALNERFFENVDTPEKAYWLGFLATDGNVYGTRIQINLKDGEHLEKFAKALGSSAKVKPYLSHGHQLFKISFRSKQMAEDLARVGIMPKKSFTVSPWDGPQELMKHYWRGCVDGDGWVSCYPKSQQVGYCGNINMVDGFTRFIVKEGEGLPVRPSARIYNVRTGSISKSAAIIRKLGYAEEGAVCLDRKRAAALLILERATRRANALSGLPETPEHQQSLPCP